MKMSEHESLDFWDISFFFLAGFISVFIMLMVFDIFFGMPIAIVLFVLNSAIGFVLFDYWGRKDGYSSVIAVVFVLWFHLIVGVFVLLAVLTLNGLTWLSEKWVETDFTLKFKVPERYKKKEE